MRLLIGGNVRKLLDFSNSSTAKNISRRNFRVFIDRMGILTRLD
jgi:hypothetical protein